MADDQSQKNTSIDDLVRELSKNSMNPVTPPSSPAPSQGPRPSFSVPKPPVPSPVAGSRPIPPPPIPSKPPVVNPMTPATPAVPRPQFNAPLPSKPVSPSPSSVSGPSTSSTSGVKEYQSSIRTMNDDISRLKQGQKLAGIDVPRKIEQVTPPSSTIPPKPALPNQQFKVPSVNLGETQKSGPLVQSKDVPKPSATPKVEPKTQIYIPQEGQKGGNRNMLFIGIGVAAIAAGFAYWFFILRSPVPEVIVESPTPIPTEIPALDLDSIFSGLAEISTAVVYKDHQPTDQKGAFIKLKDEQNQNTLTLILNWLNPPQSVKDNLSNESAALIFIQSELFDAKGQLKISELERRLVLIIEVKDASLLSQALNEWETTIVNETISNLWDIDKSKQGSSTFLGNTYRGVGVRYKNFPFADRSIDYAIVDAFNDKTYFVIGNSRESVYSTIDKLKGF